MILAFRICPHLGWHTFLRSFTYKNVGILGQPYLHVKFAKCLFLLRFKVAFDCSVIKLAAQLVEVSVRVKSFNCQIQTGDSVRYSFLTALERLLYRNELISESKGRDRMPCVNLKNDLPILSVQHERNQK